MPSKRAASASYVAFGAFFGALAAVAGGRRWLQSYQRVLDRREEPRAVCEDRFVELGGVQQWITVRGRDEQNPVVLWLHGGPGAVVSAEAHAFTVGWDRFFTVVQWDQRGAGRSAIEGALLPSMTVEQLYADAEELVELLCRRFRKQKVIVVGHSWGTGLGVLLAARRPDRIAAYVGLGSWLDWRDNADEKARLLQREIDAAGDTRLQPRLDSLGPMPSPDDSAFWPWIEHSLDLIHATGGSWRAVRSRRRQKWQHLTALFLSPEARWRDLVRYAVDQERPTAATLALMASANDVDLRELAGHDFDVPVIIIHGAHDLHCPLAPVREYFDDLRAPFKRLIVLPDAAHFVQEDPGAYFEAMLNVVRPAALERGA